MTPYILSGIRMAKDHALASLAMVRKRKKMVHFPEKFIASFEGNLSHIIYAAHHRPTNLIERDELRNKLNTSFL